MNLTQELLAYKENVLANIPKEVMAVMEAGAQEMVVNEVGKNALKVGDTIPSFKLSNAVGQEIDIKECLEQGPLILNFYRGAWCPYCNLELQAYQEVLSDINAKGANLVAISPELPDSSMSLKEKHNLGFELLSDVDHKVSKEFGIVFKLNDDLRNLYKQFGFDLDGAQGNTNGELPLPATYVVDTDGTILLADMHLDYTKRLEPTDAIAAIKTSK